MENTLRKSYFFGLFKTETSNKSAETKAIIANLTSEFVDRTRAEIEKWRMAINAALDTREPRWHILQDMYENLLTDGHLSAVLNIRKSAVLSKRFYIRDRKTGKENAEKTTLINKKWFFDVLSRVLDAKFFGYTVLELTNSVNSVNSINSINFQLIPRRNCVPQFNAVVKEIAGIEYFDLNLPIFKNRVISVQNDYILGEINKIVHQLIWKRNAQQTWADFSERFGIPLISATTTKTNKADLDKIEAMLKNLGQAAMAVLPEGTKTEIHDNTTKGDPYNIFLKQIDLVNLEISKAILHNTMLIDDGSSRSQSEVHERMFNILVAGTDRRNLEFFVNDKLFLILAANGLNLEQNDEFIFDRAEEITMPDHWTIIQQALQSYEIPDEWVSQRFNFPITARKENSVNSINSVKSVNSPKASFTANFR